MSLLNKLIPINLLEEKETFLHNPTYNPQFVFEEPVDPVELIKYGLPQPKYLAVAREILDRTYFGRNEADLNMMEGKIQSQTEVTRRFEHFLKMHQLEKNFDIVWSSSFVSRATITSDTIKLRTNSEFREQGLIGVIYHEIGTHALRRHNYEKHAWYKRKKKFGFTTDYLRTEEGLASLHSLLPKNFKSAYTVAIRYIAAEYAQTHSLAELWNFLGKYTQDPETRWMITFRQKRGMADTSQPGGFTKDIVYFEGLVDTWKWLTTHNYDLPSLYYGKIAQEDVDLAVELDPDFDPLLPSFYTLDKDEYASQINEIGTFNKLDEVSF